MALVYRCDHCEATDDAHSTEPLDPPMGWVVIETNDRYSHYCSTDHALQGLVRIQI